MYGLRPARRQDDPVRAGFRYDHVSQTALGPGGALAAAGATGNSVGDGDGDGDEGRAEDWTYDFAPDQPCGDWVNHPARMVDAAYKPVQLVVARECGLSVPDTLITRDPDAVRAFAAEGPTVSKGLGANTVREQGVLKVRYTRLLSRSDLADLSGPAVATHLFQRWVPKEHEARVVVIGDDVTAIGIRAGSTAARIDWRADYSALSYEPVDPPQHVAAGISALCRALRLTYAALDSAISPGGEWTFLEVNPAGQYGWIEDRTGIPLTDRLADLLAAGRSR